MTLKRQGDGVSQGGGARVSTDRKPRAIRKDCKTRAIDIETVCKAIGAGHTLTEVAADLGLSVAGLVTWINSDPERSARAREARALTAQVWDDKAEVGLSGANDPFELQRAKELAHHYRWRASKIAPRLYGDRVHQEITGPEGGPLKVDLSALSDQELDALEALISSAQGALSKT